MKSPFIIASFIFVTLHLTAQNVGIGTTTPAKPLDVALPGGIQISRTENNSANNEIYFSDNGQLRSLDNNHRIVFNRSSDQLEFYEKGNIVFHTGDPSREIMRITSDGTVGIGTSQPYFDLHIHNPNTTAAIKFTNSISGNFPDHGADLGQFGYNFSINNWENGSIFFNTNHLQRVAIDPLGNVGIGTISPTVKLDVIGNANINGNASINGVFKIVDGTQGDGKVLTSDGNGNASWKDIPAKQVAFFAKLNNSFTFNGGGLNRISFDTTFFNNGNAYDTLTDIFTAPSQGLYQFYVNIQWASSFTGGSGLGIRKLTAPSYFQNAFMNDPVFNDTEGVSAIYYLNAGDQVDFWISESGAGSQTLFALNATYAYGYKIY